MASTKGIKAGRAFVELFADNTKLVRGLRYAEQKVKQFGNSLKHIGMQMAAAGAAMLSPLIGSAKVFGDFEKNMKMVSTMLDQPMKFMGAFGSGIRDLAKYFGESTSVLSKGMYDILSAAIDPAGALNVLKVAAKSAIGGISNTAIAVDGLTSVLNAFQLSAKMATTVSDVMFRTVKRGKLTFTELAAQIGRVAPMARAAGMSFRTMFAAIATMTRQGLGVDEAVTRVANILKQAPKASKDFVGLIQSYVGKDLGEILIQFPEIRAATGISALAGDISGLIKDINLMNSAGGASEEAFQKMAGGLLYEMNRVWAAIKDTAIAVGEALAPELKKLAGWLIENSGAVSKWISENKGLVISFAKLAAGITALGISLVVLGTIITSAGAVIGVLASAIGLLFSPVGLVVSAIVGMGAAIVKYTTVGGQAAQWLGGKFDFLRQDAETAFNGMADALASGNITHAAKILWLTLDIEWLRGTNSLMKMWNNTVGFMAKVMVGAFTVLSTTANIFVFGLEAALVSAANGFMKAWSAASDWVSKRLIDIRGLIDGSFDTVAAKAQIDLDAKARSDAREARLADVGERFNAGLKESGEWNKEMRSNIDQGVQAEIDDRTLKLADARQEWREAIEQARKMRENAMKPQDEPDAPPPPGMPETPNAPKMPGMPMLPNIGEALKEAAFSSKGTFSAFAAFGLGVGSGVEERAAKASEETAKNTRRMLKEIQDAQLEFT